MSEPAPLSAPFKLQLAYSEERLRLLVESVTDYAIFMLDPEGYIVSWNAGAERIKGYTEAEVIGNTSRRITTRPRRRPMPVRSAGRPPL